MSKKKRKKIKNEEIEREIESLLAPHYEVENSKKKRRLLFNTKLK